MIFDWGDTLMRVLPFEGRMADWPVVEAMPGAAAALGAIHGRFKVAVVSNAQASGPTDVLRALARVELARFVDHVLTPSVLHRTKDDEHFWATALTALSVSATHCVVVGDSLRRDILPAVGAGIRAIWLSGDEESSTLYDGPIIRGLGELQGALSAGGYS